MPLACGFESHPAHHHPMKKRQEIAEKTFPHYLIILLISVLGFLVYYNSLKGTFVFDDKALVVDNPFIKNFSYLKDIFTAHLFKGSGIYSNFYRPIQSLSFMIDYHFWEMNPFGYHLTNVLIHILNAVSVYFLIFLIFKKQDVAIITGVLFCVHTVLSWPVNYIASRADLLSPFFLLISFILYILYRESRKHRYVFYIFSVLCFIVSILSKEVGAILPFMLLFYLYCFPWLKRDEKNDARRPAALIWPFFIVLVVYALLRATVLNFAGKRFLETTTGLFPLHIRLFTTSKVLMIYLRLLFLPLGLHMEWNIEPAVSFTQDEVFLSIIALCIIAAFAYFLSKTCKPRFFALGWFFITLIPYSNIIPLNYFMGEAWLYVPSIGFLALLATYLSDLRKRSKLCSIIVISIIFLVTACYGLLTVRRANVWANPVNLYTEVLRYSPDNTKARINLGVILAESGSYEEALEKYHEAAELLPDDAGVRSNLGTLYANKKMYDTALEEFKKAVELNPKDYVAHNNIGILYKQKGDIKKAMEEYAKALELNPTYPLTYNNIGNIYLETGQYDAAIRFYKNAIRLDPNRAAFYANLGKAYRNKGLHQEAIESFEKALELEPGHKDAMEGLKPLN